MTEPYQPDAMKDLARFYDSRVMLKGGQSIFAMRTSLARKGRVTGQGVMIPIGYHLRGVGVNADGTPLCDGQEPEEENMRSRQPRRLKPEEQLHRAVADYLRAVLEPPAFFSTFPAGGGGRIRGAKLKRAGLLPGMPDLLVLWTYGNLGMPDAQVLGIELKSKTGQASEEQRAVAKMFALIGSEVRVCRSIDDVQTGLKAWGVPTRQAKP